MHCPAQKTTSTVFQLPNTCSTSNGGVMPFALVAVIQTLEPPSDLAEAVQDIVRALMLMADVTRPRAAAQAPVRRPAPGSRATAKPGRRTPAARRMISPSRP